MRLQCIACCNISPFETRKLSTIEDWHFRLISKKKSKFQSPKLLIFSVLLIEYTMARLLKYRTIQNASSVRRDQRHNVIRIGCHCGTWHYKFRKALHVMQCHVGERALKHMRCSSIQCAESCTVWCCVFLSLDDVIYGVISTQWFSNKNI